MSMFSITCPFFMWKLLSFENHMCGIAKIDYCPEVEQYICWNYFYGSKLLPRTLRTGLNMISL